MTCNLTRPSCPAGSVATIYNGCYTGDCEAIASCDVTPACDALAHQADCLARVGTCAATYTGLNCKRPDGTACQSGDTCECETFTFHSCAAATTIP